MIIHSILSKKPRFKFVAIVFFCWIISSQSAIGQQLIRVELDNLEAEDKLLEAYLLLQKNKREEAINIIKGLENQYPKEAVFSYELSKLYWEEENADKALAYCDKMLAKDAKNPWFLSYAAFVYENSGKIDKALQANIKMAEIDSLNFSHASRAAKNYADLDQLDRGIETINTFEKRHGKAHFTIVEKHHLYRYKGANDRAEKVLLEWVKEHRKDIGALELLASFQVDQGNEEGALKSYEQLLKLVPDHFEAQRFVLNYGAADNGGDDDSDLQWYLDQNIDINLKIGKILATLETIQSPEGTKYEDLLAKGKIITESHPKEAKSYALLGDLYFLKEDYSNSLKYYEEALNLDQTKYIVWDNAMQSAHKSGNDKKLTSISENALLFFPDRFSSFLYSAISLYRNKGYLEAKALLQESRLMIGRNTQHQQLYKAWNALISSEVSQKVPEVDASWAGNPLLSSIDQYLQTKLNPNFKISASDYDISVAYGRLGLAQFFYLKKDIVSLEGLNDRILPNSEEYNAYLELLKELYSEMGKASEAEKISDILNERGAYLP